MRADAEFERFLHRLAILGVVGLFAWVIVGAMGVAAGYIEIAREPAIRFMTAILVLMMPSVIYPDIQKLRYRGLTPEERLGLADRPHG